MTNPFEKMLNLPHSENEEEEEKEFVSVTVRQLEDIQIFLEKSDVETFLGRRSENSNDSGAISAERGQELLHEFQAAEHALDSNTKIKMYKRIKDIFIQKMESAVELLDVELRELESRKPETVGIKIEFDTKLEDISAGIEKLKELNFWDLTEMKHLEDRLGKLEKNS